MYKVSAAKMSGTKEGKKRKTTRNRKAEISKENDNKGT